ncbi:MAG TPA: polysaccharide deacetylase family protein [Acidimicrobiales bacterium]|nr:polysaccharide deacetylase family protein [Acidimicrobiales bacterium]
MLACPGCQAQDRLGRRRFLRLLATGAALALASCSPGPRRPAARRPSSPASSGQVLTEQPPPSTLPLGQIPPPRPGLPQVVSAGPPGTRQIALTVDDGYCGPCIAGYVEFAQSSGIQLTFNPNGVYHELWTPTLVEAVRQMVAAGQVQIGNHTWDHANLLRLPTHRVVYEISRNEAWIEETFGVTARPWFRPPFGFYDRRVLEVAADLGYTRVLMWNGTLGDATPESPEQLLALAERWLKPGTIVLGHMNHPTVLSLFTQLEAIIVQRNLEPVTLDEMFGTSRLTG